MRFSLDNNKKNTYGKRFLGLILFFSICLIVLLWRMFDLMVVDRNFLKNQGDARILRTINIPAFRGMITDRNGEPLAVSTVVKAVWANPKEFKPAQQKLSKLANYLKISEKMLLNKIEKSRARAKEFIYLKRGVTPAFANDIENLNIRGIYLKTEFRRFYPEGEVSAQLLGFTNIDDRGQEGLELAYDDWLRGIPGKNKVIKDRLGNIISDVAIISQPRAGKQLALSIDRRIQYIAYRELKKTVIKHQAKSGSVVVLDARSGEVLALANQPSFNPNQRLKKINGNMRNRAFTDVFEPGSVIKAFTIATALESSQYTPDSLIDTSPGWMVLNGNTIKDDIDHGKMSITEILKRSSNVGVSKLILSLPSSTFLTTLTQVGFGQITESGFPGESSGYLKNTVYNNPFVLSTLAFGYGLSVTPIQLARAYSIFANEGKLLPISLLKINHQPKGSQVLDKKVATQLLSMLEDVVENGGTGTRAKVKGVRVAGKTGTVRIAGKKGYNSNHHIATFVGIAPVDDPRLLIVVVIDDPRKGSYYSSVVAAPTFSRIMTDSLRILIK